MQGKKVIGESVYDTSGRFALCHSAYYFLVPALYRLLCVAALEMIQYVALTILIPIKVSLSVCKKGLGLDDEALSALKVHTVVLSPF